MSPPTESRTQASASTPTDKASSGRRRLAVDEALRHLEGLHPAAAQSFLELAQVKPGGQVPPGVQKAAEAAFAKIAAALKENAASLPASEEIERLIGAGDAQLRTILSENVPRFRGLIELWEDFRPGPEDRPTGRPPGVGNAAGPTAAPAAPKNVVAAPGNASALVEWSPPAQPVETYTITPFIGSAPQTPRSVPGLTPFALVTGLTNGTTYTFKVRAANALGTSPDSLPSNAVTPAAPGSTVPFQPTIPPLTSEPVLQLDPAAESARRLLTEASRIGQKWRFEYLKAQALRAAQESLAYESHVTTLMQLTMSKATAAEEILNATLLDAAARLDEIGIELAELSGLPAVDELVGPLADAASEALLLPQILLWLARTSPINFWIGLFEAMIRDLASVFLSDTDFSRTRRFLANAFENDLDGVREGVQKAVGDMLQRLDGEVDKMIEPLKAAIADVIGGTEKAMAAVFEAYDMPLLMNPPAPGSTFDVPDVDPLRERAQELQSEVEKQANLIKDEIRARLEPLLDATSGGDLFVVIAVTYLVIPIVAFLAISLAGGPFSAALLAAVVLIAAQELIRLLLKWLTGPLLKKVDEVRRLADDLIGRLNRLFATKGDMVRNLSPELILEILSNQLREFRNLLPDEFVREAAALLQEARDVVLRNGVELGMAAEQSLGFDHGTAFDVIGKDYSTRRRGAPQLPGGDDESLFSGAALVRDIGRLEQQRTSLLDGRESEFTIRLSLFRLLGGDPANPSTRPGEFSRFLSTREAVVHVTEPDLVDDRFPGVYRALVKEVRVAGVFNAPPIGSTTGGVPISVTHLGESRTRVKRNANPSAPPLKLPECVRLTEEDFGVRAADQAALETAVERAFATVQLATREVYLWALLLGFADEVGAIFQKACIETVPAAVAQRIAAELDVCGFVDPQSCRERTEQILLEMSWLDVIGALIADATPQNLKQPPPFSSLGPVIDSVAQTIRTGTQRSTNLRPSLVDAAREAYRRAVEEFQFHIGKWGGAYLEEDPDPHVRSLGFATLVRPMEAETAVFTLFPQDVLPASALPPPPVNDAPPTGTTSSLQYRPFENRGVDGRLLLRLEPGPDGTGQLSDQLSDVVLEVVVRALHDEDLGATVRASRRQRRRLLELAGRLPETPRTIVVPGTRPEVVAATGGTRTIHFSLRAQRDRAIDSWTTALQIDPALVPTIAGLGPLTRLDTDEAFTPLRPPGETPLQVSVAFDDAPPPAAPTESDLLALEHTIAVAPSDIGFSPDALTAGLRVVEESKLLSVGIAVIPMQAGVAPPGVDEETDDRLGLTLEVSSLLQGMLPGFSAGPAPLIKRLVMTGFAPPPAEVPSIPLVDVFGAPQPPKLTLSVPPEVVGESGRLYDVIFSLTFAVPAISAKSASGAVR